MSRLTRTSVEHDRQGGVRPGWTSGSSTTDSTATGHGGNLQRTAPAPDRAKRCATLMFQGTSSSVGKSVLAAAMCRILLQDGVRVAPFKAQNISLNSFVTADGGEMGRAQVVQAQACRVEPDVRMNPVLLKPCAGMGCQVIVRGRPVSHVRIDGVQYRTTAFEAATQCFDSLAAEHDAVVLEGAGSPAEVNLKDRDIVNMAMARHARAPVLLVGDIDRGGVFASFIGTMEVLDQWERDHIAGFVINRFRGDASLLGSALDYMLAHTGRPVLGVVPHIPDLGLPEEDSVEFASGARDAPRPGGDHVEIAVIDLPHIANFTDLDALRIEPDVHVRVVGAADTLGQPDAVVLPGSKNVIHDLDFLRQTGLADQLGQLVEAGRSLVVGICGGFQMLGTDIGDPHGVESANRTARGLGLLPGTTVLDPEKTLTRVDALHVVSGLDVRGYEIHHGRTDVPGLTPLVTRRDGETIGVGTPDGLVWGTYLHGLFDADPFRRWFIDQLRVRRGLAPLGRVVATYDLEPALDRLADTVRASLHMDTIYRLMGIV